MEDMNLIVQTADKKRKAEITVSDTQTFGEIIEAAIENWALPRGGDINYKIALISRTPPEILSSATTLAGAGVRQGETLELQADVHAGGRNG